MFNLLLLYSLKKCALSEASCASLASALKSETSRLRELDLGDNVSLDSGVQPLSELVESSQYRLQTLRCVRGWAQVGNQVALASHLALRLSICLIQSVGTSISLLAINGHFLDFNVVYMCRFCDAEGSPVTLTGEWQISDLEKDKSESPRSSCDQLKGRPPVLCDEPGPSSNK